jgi:hypothetical protein
VTDPQDPLADAQVIHLRPDDIVVVRMPHPISPEQAKAVQRAFEGRRVVVLDAGVEFGVTSWVPS